MKSIARCSRLFILCAALPALDGAAAMAADGDPGVRLVAPSPVASDAFGTSVGVSGDTVVVGAPQDFKSGSLPGAAYVFVRNGNAWDLQQTLTAPVAAGADGFGIAVAISGDTVVAGAPKANSGAGAAYVFTRTGTVWGLEQAISPAELAADDGFGRSVALDRDTVVVSASRDESLAPSPGAAYVFVRSGSSWTQEQKLTGSDEGASDSFGRSVAISRDTVLVGASGKSGNRGAGYLFARSAGTWTEQQKLTASDEASLWFVGRSVALVGDTALLGAFGADDFRGAAYGFVRSGTTWTQEVKLTDLAAPPAGKLGSSVALSWARSLAGANLDATRTQLQGVAVLHSRQGGVWTEKRRLAAPTQNDINAVLGEATAMSNGILVAGAPGDSSAALRAGAAFVFDASVPVDVSLPPRWTTASAYPGSITPTGGTAPYTWRVLTGALPDGVTLDTQTGAIGGTPTTLGTSFAVIECADADGDAAEVEVPIDVAPPIAFAQQFVPPAANGRSYRRTFLTTGGVPPNTWSMDGGGGVFVIDPATGTVSATPSATGKFPVTVHCTDATNAIAPPFDATLQALDVLSLAKNTVKVRVPGASPGFERILELVGGTELSVSAKGKKGFAPATLDLRFDNDFPVDAGSALTVTTTGFRLKRFVVPHTGRYTLRVTPWGIDAANSIAVTIGVVAPKSATQRITLADGGRRDFSFGLLPGSKVAVRVKAAKGSAVDPQIIALFTTTETVVVPVVDGRRVSSFKQVTVAEGGTATVAMTTRNGTSGDAVATAIIRPPKRYVYVDNSPAGADE